MANSLYPDQAQRFFEPDVGPNCLPRLLADDTGRKRVYIKPSQKLHLQIQKGMLHGVAVKHITRYYVYDLPDM